MRLAVVLAIALAACTPGDTPVEPVRAAAAAGTGPTDARPDARPMPVSPDSLAGAFEGHYSAGFEHTGFVPCADTTEAWWTEPAMTATPLAGGQTQMSMRPAADLHARYTAATGDAAGTFGHGVTVWARLHGRATPRREASRGAGYGHLGAYARAFAVDSVEALVRDTVVAGCPVPHSLRP